MFIVTLTYQVSMDEIDNHLQSHLEWLQSYYNQGKLLVNGRRNDGVAGGVIVAYHLTRDELDAAMSEDPFISNHLATYDVVEFTPRMAAPSLSFLVE